MLAAFDKKVQFSSGAALACRVHAMSIAEVQALRRDAHADLPTEMRRSKRVVFTDKALLGEAERTLATVRRVGQSLSDETDPERRRGNP